MVDSHRSSVGLIKYSSQYIDQLLGLKSEFIKNTSINCFLPNIIAKNHDEILINFLENGIRKFTKESKSVYIKLLNKKILEVKAFIKFYVNYSADEIYYFVCLQKRPTKMQIYSDSEGLIEGYSSAFLSSINWPQL